MEVMAGAHRIIEVGNKARQHVDSSPSSPWVYRAALLSHTPPHPRGTAPSPAPAYRALAFGENPGQRSSRMLPVQFCLVIAHD